MSLIYSYCSYFCANEERRKEKRKMFNDASIYRFALFSVFCVTTETSAWYHAAFIPRSSTPSSLPFSYLTLSSSKCSTFKYYSQHSRLDSQNINLIRSHLVPEGYSNCRTSKLDSWNTSIIQTWHTRHYTSTGNTLSVISV